MDDASLSKFIAAVEQVRRDGAGAIDKATCDEVARALGWSAEDLELARQHGERDLLRGEGFLRHRAWEDAGRSLREAEALLPDDLRVLYALARACEGQRDEAGARRYTDRCLALDPRHEPSFALRARLGARPRRTRALRAIGALIVGGGALVFAAGALVKPSTRSEALCGGQRYCDRPAVVTAAPALRIERPTFQISPRGVRLEFGGELTHPAGETSELEQLVTELRLFDERDRLVGAREIVALPDFAPPLRPGDTAPFYFSETVPASTRRAELVALRRREVPAPAAYDAPTPVALAFEPAAPGHFRLRGGFRVFHRAPLGEMTSFEAVLEIENQGDGAIRTLELEWRAYDEAGEALGRADRKTVAYAHMPPMRPHERRLVPLRLWVPRRVASEAVVVTLIQ